MLLAPGTHLGPYEITGPLGSGGMGEVYRARDTRLERTVAIKILPAQFSSDPVRKQRFEREAKTVSSLNHPHICVLHDIGHQDGMDYLVMECVEGETLAKRLERGPLPLEQVLNYGAQIADALDRAHRSGVVHRDLKPANIMLTKSGAKLLDFGLAKSFPEPAPLADALTETTAESRKLTSEGVLVGTFQYMAPEQLEGKQTDARTDIFALGTVIYEMFTGRPAFSGKSKASLIAAILSSEPTLMRAPQPLAPALERLVRACLAKDPDERFQSAHDVKLQLEAMAEPESETSVRSAARAVGRWRQMLPWTLAIAAGLTAGVAYWYFLGRRLPASQPTIRFAFPSNEPLPIYVPALALSPDASRLAYAVQHGGTTQLYVRAMDQFEAKPLANTEGGYAPFFSPDGRWIAFFAEGKLKKVRAAGGPALVICEAPEGQGGAWSTDGTIFFAPILSGGIYRVPEAGGTPEPVTRLDSQQGELFHYSPELLPGGRALLFARQKGNSADQSAISVLSLDTGRWRTLLEAAGSHPHYLATGHIVYARSGTLMAVPFDLARLAVTGSPVPVLDGVATDVGDNAQVAFSADGSVAYVAGSAAGVPNNRLVWVDGHGAEHTLTDMRRAYEDMSLSPDGRWLALTVIGTPIWNIWVHDLARGTLSRLTFEGDNRDPLISPDGRRVLYASLRNGRWGLFLNTIDGSGQEERLTTNEFEPWAVSWHPDGKELAFIEFSAGGYGLSLVGLESDHKPRQVMRLATGLVAFSPDGKWIAYDSAVNVASEIYVQRFPGPGGKLQISTDGGRRPQWSKDGRELFYRSGERFMRVAIQTEPVFTASKPEVLFTGRYLETGHDYAVMPDGRRFIFIKTGDEAQPHPAQLNVILSWSDEVKRRFSPMH